MSDSSGKRINKFLSEAGICSRREADRMIEMGQVTINGKVPVAGQKVKPRDKVRVNGHEVENNAVEAVYLLFNKPTGIVTTTDSSEPDNVINFVNYPERIFPVGRLDKDSEGLLILTNDGDVVNKILRAGNQHDKVYEVTVDKPVTEKFVHDMGHGVPILGQVTKKCKVEQVAPFIFRITLQQGLNRQIRRMCEYFGYEVQKLKRTRIMHLNLDLPPGDWRPFTEQEIQEMERLLENSSKTQQAKTSKQKAKPSKPKKASGSFKGKGGPKGPKKGGRPGPKASGGKGPKNSNRGSKRGRRK
jgi:23S rRNA pseudouridine2604 synthase